MRAALFLHLVRVAAGAGARSSRRSPSLRSTKARRRDASGKAVDERQRKFAAVALSALPIALATGGACFAIA
jgi:hypothetical protein